MIIEYDDFDYYWDGYLDAMAKFCILGNVNVIWVDSTQEHIRLGIR